MKVLRTIIMDDSNREENGLIEERRGCNVELNLGNYNQESTQNTRQKYGE